TRTDSPSNTTKKVKITKAAKIKTETRKLSFGEKRELEQVEEEIKSLGKQKNNISNSLNKSDQNFEELANWGKELKSIESTLSKLEDRWLELSDGI
ncbi:hypothetical protein MNBD_BACTEROID06-526, partial [hydrothermal vent metagenome]